MQGAGKTRRGDRTAMSAVFKRAPDNIFAERGEGKIVDLVAAVGVFRSADEFRTSDPEGTHGGNPDARACQFVGKRAGIAVQESLGR